MNLTLSVDAPISTRPAAPRGMALRRHAIPIRGLPRTLEGLRLVQLSDTHLGQPFSIGRIRRAVRLALDRRPDLIVLTGDYITTGTRSIEHAADLFAPLAHPDASSLGVLAVLGNHDHYGDASRMRAALRRVGIRVIDNDRIFLDARTMTWRDSLSIDPLDPHARDEPANPVAAEALCFAGLADLEEDKVDVRRAFKDVEDQTPRILLCHNPDALELPGLGAHRIDLALCGHTHGGQIRLPFFGTPIIPSRYGRKYAGGLVQSPIGPAIVSRGIGTSLLPIRWGVAAEVVEVRLELRTLPPGEGGASSPAAAGVFE